MPEQKQIGQAASTSRLGGIPALQEHLPEPQSGPPPLLRPARAAVRVVRFHATAGKLRCPPRGSLEHAFGDSAIVRAASAPRIPFTRSSGGVPAGHCLGRQAVRLQAVSRPWRELIFAAPQALVVRRAPERPGLPPPSACGVPVCGHPMSCAGGHSQVGCNSGTSLRHVLEACRW